MYKGVAYKSGGGDRDQWYLELPYQTELESPSAERLVPFVQVFQQLSLQGEW